MDPFQPGLFMLGMCTASSAQLEFQYKPPDDTALSL